MKRKTEVVGIRVSTETKDRIDHLSKGDSSRLREVLEYIINTSTMFPDIPTDVIMLDKIFWKNQWEFTSKKGITILANTLFERTTKNLQTFDDYIYAIKIWFEAHGTIININNIKHENRLLIPHNMHKNFSLCMYELFKLLSIKTNRKIQEYKIADDYISLTFGAV